MALRINRCIDRCIDKLRGGGKDVERSPTRFVIRRNGNGREELRVNLIVLGRGLPDQLSKSNRSMSMKINDLCVDVGSESAIRFSTE